MWKPGARFPRTRRFRSPRSQDQARGASASSIPQRSDRRDQSQPYSRYICHAKAHCRCGAFLPCCRRAKCIYSTNDDPQGCSRLSCRPRSSQTHSVLARFLVRLSGLVFSHMSQIDDFAHVLGARRRTRQCTPWLTARWPASDSRVSEALGMPYPNRWCRRLERRVYSLRERGLQPRCGE